MPEWEAQTAQTLALVDAPLRDLISITQRLKLGGNTTIPAVVNPTSPNYPVGTNQQFYVADMVNKDYYPISATLKIVTSHAYWYVKNGYAVNLDTLTASAQHFDTQIYPTDRRIFGSEPNPGIDNDPHITVLLAPIPGVNGYFSSSDTYPKVVNPFSNEREMIYIAAKPEADPGDTQNAFEATLAHESQHMIQWNVHRNRDVWFDEGCSEIAMFANGYGPGGFDYPFSQQPDTQLNAWASEPGQSAAHYGASFLFLRILMAQYGGEKAITNLLKQPGLGIAAIDAVVKQAGNPAGFEGAFKDWLIANTLNNPGIYNGKYSYPEGGRVNDTRAISAIPRRVPIGPPVCGRLH